MNETGIDVVVVGAGVIGCVCAYELAKAGLRVEVVERGQLCEEASWASAGMVSQAIPGDDPLSRFHEIGARMFPALAAEISDRSGIDASFRVNGGFRLCADAAEWPEWESRYRDLRSSGVACELLGSPEVVAREPALSERIAGGIYFPEDGQVDPRRYTRVLALAASALGVRFQFGSPVTGFLREGSRVIGVETPLGPVHGGLTVIATGAWSRSMGDLLGFTLPMRPAKGQIVKLEATPPLLSHTVHCGDFYLTARADGTVLAGSTVEFVGFDTRVTPAGAKHLLDQALEVAPGLADSRLSATWAGLRPYPDRKFPYLGPAPGLEGLFVAAGHFRTGISPSPITGKLVAEWATGRPTTLPLEPFGIDAPAGICPPASNRAG